MSNCIAGMSMKHCGVVRLGGNSLIVPFSLTDIS